MSELDTRWKPKIKMENTWDRGAHLSHDSFLIIEEGNIIKVFLSLGMHGRTMEDIHKDISAMERELRRRYPDKELIFVDNADCTGLDADGRLYYLGEAIKKMDKCDAVYFHSGYKNHKGCLIEEKICELYGLKKIVQGS